MDTIPCIYEHNNPLLPSIFSCINSEIYGDPENWISFTMLDLRNEYEDIFDDYDIFI